MTERWISLTGAVNVRDLGGLPTRSGATTRFGRLLRSDNLQGLTAADVRRLVTEIGVTDVVDLRTGVEVTLEGPGPLTTVDDVTVHHLSLYPEAGARTDVQAEARFSAEASHDKAEARSSAEASHDKAEARFTADASDVKPETVLPWSRAARSRSDAGQQWESAGRYYSRYLLNRPDSVVAALRTIAASPGATIAHCAAGKDRTGVICALALSVADVEPEAIVEDYVLTGERIEAVIERLRSTPTYAGDLDGRPVDSHRPRPEAMQTFLADLGDHYGGPLPWLTRNGWTEADTAALVAQLIEA